MKNNWCIKGSVEFAQWVAEQELIDKQPFKFISGDDPTKYYSIDDDGIWRWFCSIPKEKIITLQEYLDINNKKIIGYKVKESFKQVAAKVTGTTDYDSFLRDGCHFMPNSIARQRLLDAQVLDLWCDPVYESKPEFKVGDIVLAKGNISRYPCNIGEIIEIYNYTNNPYRYRVYFDKDGSRIYSSVIRHATPEEIEQYNSKSKVFTIHSTSGDFELEVSKQGIFYKKENVWICPIDIKKLLDISNDYTIQYDKDGLSNDWPVRISTISIGCKHSCNIADIESAYNHYESLQ